MKGTYLLYLHLLRSSNIKFGKQKSLEFPKGYYIYVGSALANYGSSTLINRLKRHIRSSKEKSNHWHIDFFLTNKDITLINLYLLPSSKRLECLIAQEISKVCYRVIEGFGASDCDCKGHLFYFEKFTPYFL
jgi:Uri superfamily endonuclease